ncbi:MAG: MmgE/PrpD family protein [Alphaproteobacteria bacterium]|nr:MmgE/PrpD family protein [Alphaproteobacteria bacterium]
MKRHLVSVGRRDRDVPRQEQLCHAIACVAADPVAVDADVAEMAACRILDSIGVSIHGLREPLVRHAVELAARRPRRDGARILGIAPERRFDAERAGWANQVALRARDLNDMFVGAEYAHPSDSIPALIAVAQQTQASTAALVRAIVTAYEVHVALARAIPLSRHGFDPSGHLGPALVAGLGTLRGLPLDTIRAALDHIVHLGLMPRRAPDTPPSHWRILGAAHIARLAIEVVEESVAGLRAPTPAYESPEGMVGRWMGATGVAFELQLPEPGEPRRAILATYPKAHEAQFQAQAFIDLAIDLHATIDRRAIDTVEIRTSRRIHGQIGTAWRAGAHGTAMPAPAHDLRMIFATALEDGAWSMAPASTRASTAALVDRITTAAAPEWTVRAESTDPHQQGFGGEAIIEFLDGRRFSRSINRPRCHALEQPWTWHDYDRRFHRLCAPLATPDEIERLSRTCRDLAGLQQDTARTPVSAAELCLSLR